MKRYTKVRAYVTAHREQVLSRIPDEIVQAGGLYSVHIGGANGTFGVVKVLVLEPPVIHIRLYQNTFPTRPSCVDPATLVLGGFRVGTSQDETSLHKQHIGIGHMPWTVRSFIATWQPVLLTKVAVTEDELDGYTY